MPWSKVRGDSRCPTSRPWAVVKDDDNELEGCHATEDDANDQLAALNAAEADEELAELAQEVVQLTTTTTSPFGGKPNQGTSKDQRLRRNRRRQQSQAETLQEEDDCPPGQHRMPDGSCMPDSEMENGGPFKPWTGVLALEGTETGDGREFAPGSLEWAEPPLPLLWQRESEPQHMRSVVVGRIDSLERVGSEIRGSGVIDLGSEAGQEVARQLEGGFAGGVSVDVDSVKDSDVELVFPDADDGEVEEDEDGDILMLFGPPPEKVVFHRGRLRGATLVALPAFVEARIELVEESEEGLVASLLTRHAQSLGAIGTHDTGTSDASWDGGEQELRLPTPMSTETARNMYAWMADGAVEDGEVTKNELKFPHHEVSNGQPGPANLTALSSGIAVLNGGRGGTSIPAADRQGVYDHLAAHLRDAGREPPALLDLEDALVAGGFPAAPPLTWFQDPTFSGPTPWTVTDEGHVFGHLALWGVCHTSFQDRCVTPPRERDYPYFTLGELKTREGEALGVGQITLGTGHARGGAAVPAVEHYDHTGYAAADVTVGEDRYGIWVSGALRSGLSEDRVRELRAAKLSGDWRRVGGRLRLVAVLAVNVPGYPVPRMRARYDTDGLVSLVAAGVVTDERRDAYDKVRGDGYGTLRVRKAKS